MTLVSRHPGVGQVKQTSKYATLFEFFYHTIFGDIRFFFSVLDPQGPNGPGNMPQMNVLATAPVQLQPQPSQSQQPQPHAFSGSNANMYPTNAYPQHQPPPGYRVISQQPTPPQYATLTTTTTTPTPGPPAAK